MNRGIVVVLLLAHMTKYGDCLSWKTVPSDPLYVLLGSNVSLSWDYQLGPGETTSGFFQIIWAREEASGWINLAVKSFQSGITVLRDRDHVSVSPSQKATFILSRVTEEHHARYRCSIESRTSLAPTTVQLNVLIPAKVVGIIGNQPYIEGHRVTLSCTVKGNPSPYVAWLSPDGTLLQNRSSLTDTNYTISSITRYQVGVYTCVTINQHGTDRRQTSILLSPIIEIISPINQTVNETDYASIYCNASGLPQPSITWAKLEEGDKVLHAGNKLVFNRVNKTDSGAYVCMATNGVLTPATATAVVYVQYPAAVEHVSLLNQIVNENSSFSLYCNATGNPRPNITWKRTGLNSKSFPVGELLTVERAELEDQGTYSCFAYNGIGITSTSSANVVVKPLVAPIFTVRPQNQTAREGQSVSMNCNATGNPLPNISWYKVGRHEAPIMNGKTFVIAAANRSNAGFYSCVATNGIGKSSTTEAFLNVQFAPSINDATTNQTVNESSTFTLHCNTTGNPEPVTTWRKIEDFSKVFPSKQHLTVKNVNHTDAGTYTCAATNFLGTSSIVIATIIVQYKPYDTQLTLNPPSNNAVVSDNVVFNCTTTAAPLATSYRFYHNGNMIDTSSNGVYNLSNAQLSHTGVYTCVPFNLLGDGHSASLNLTVYIYVPPAAEVYPSLITVNESNLLILNCNTSGNPRPSLEWRRLGSKAVISTQSTLTINSTSRRDAGSYECIARNGIGRPASAFGNVTVLYGPVIYARPTNKTVDESAPIRLLCNATGYPAPLVTWSKIDDSSRRFPNENYLFINSTTRSDTGLYQCTAANGIGTAQSATAHVTVRYKPTAPKRSITQQSWIARDTKLQCEMESDPPPRLTWSRPGRETFSVNGTRVKSSLSINPKSPGDFGAYECRGANSLGTYTVTIIVTQIVPPDPPPLLRVEPEESKVKITWKVPKNGGRPVSSYFVQVKQNRQDQEIWHNCTTINTFCDVGSVPFYPAYSVRASAASIVGYSSFLKLNVVVTEVEIRLLEVTWTEDFLDIASNNNTKLVTDIRDEIWNAYQNVTYLKGVSVIKLRKGSVIAHLRLTHDENCRQPLLPLKDEITDGYLGKIRVELGASIPSGPRKRTGLGVESLIGIIVACCLIFLLVVILVPILVHYKRKRRKVGSEVDVKKSVEDDESVNTKTSPDGSSECSCDEKKVENEERERHVDHMDVTGHLDRGGADDALPNNIPNITLSYTRPAETGETDPYSYNSHARSSRPQTREGYEKTSSRPTSHLPTEYADLQKRCGTKEKIYAELAWLEKTPKPRARLPSIRPMKRLNTERKYSLSEMLKAQGLVESDGSNENIIANQEPPATTCSNEC